MRYFIPKFYFKIVTTYSQKITKLLHQINCFFHQIRKILHETLIFLHKSRNILHQTDGTFRLPEFAFGSAIFN